MSVCKLKLEDVIQKVEESGGLDVTRITVFFEALGNREPVV